MQIEDGKGRGLSAGVNAENRLLTDAVTREGQQHATDKGLSYNINTDDLTLTSANASAILYLKNNESLDIRVEAIAVGFGLSTDGTAGMGDIKVIKNPTSGTIVDDAIAPPIIVGRNFDTTRTLAADVYIGSEAKTITDGTDYLKFYHGDAGRLFATTDTTLKPGNSLCVTVQPPAGNISMSIYVALVIHLEESTA